MSVLRMIFTKLDHGSRSTTDRGGVADSSIIKCSSLAVAPMASTTVLLQVEERHSRALLCTTQPSLCAHGASVFKKTEKKVVRLPLGVRYADCRVPSGLDSHAVAGMHRSYDAGTHRPPTVRRHTVCVCQCATAVVANANRPDQSLDCDTCADSTGVRLAISEVVNNVPNSPYRGMAQYHGLQRCWAVAARQRCTKPSSACEQASTTGSSSLHGSSCEHQACQHHLCRMGWRFPSCPATTRSSTKRSRAHAVDDRFAIVHGRLAQQAYFSEFSKSLAEFADRAAGPTPECLLGMAINDVNDEVSNRPDLQIKLRDIRNLTRATERAPKPMRRLFAQTVRSRLRVSTGCVPCTRPGCGCTQRRCLTFWPKH